MKIVLIRPQDGENINTRLPKSLNKRQGVLPPIGLSYIAGSLEGAGHSVKILDAIALNLNLEDIEVYLDKFRPDIVAVTCMTPTLPGALPVVKIAKNLGSITVIGGAHLSVYPEETLSYSYIDYGVNGEGEYVFLELIERIEKGLPLEDVQGLIYKNSENKIIVNDARIVDNIDNLSLPAYHLLPMEKYDSIIGLHPVATMISSRGCPYKCHFCFKQPADKKIRFRSPDLVVDEMEYLVQKYKVKEIMFYDDVLTAKRSHVEGICNEILKRGLNVKWEAPARVEHVDEELLALMYRAGCIRLRYGVETGDDHILKLMNKGITLEKVKHVFKITKKSGINTFAYFMIGYAYESYQSIQKTIKFSIKLNPDLVMFTIATPLPKTPLFDLAVKEGLVSEYYWKEFTLGNTNKRIPFFIADADKWVSTAYRKFYFRPNVILKKLFGIRSTHEFIKAWNAFIGLIKFKMK